MFSWHSFSWVSGVLPLATPLLAMLTFFLSASTAVKLMDKQRSGPARASVRLLICLARAVTTHGGGLAGRGPRTDVYQAWGNSIATLLGNLAGCLYRRRRDEWWADLLYEQKVVGRTGLSQARSCLASALVLALRDGVAGTLAKIAAVTRG